MPTSEMSNELKAALDAARAAAEVIRGFYQRNVKIEVKADKTPVTEADVRSEEAIRELLTRRFPTYGFYGEETGKSDMNAESVWLVDPIDGTKSFVRECPFFSTQIALMRGGRFVLGVSSAPAYNELAWAEQGGGAFLDGKQIHVSKVDSLDGAIVSTGNLKTLAASPAWARFGGLIGGINRIRGYGDFVHYHLLARAALDVVIESDVNILDIAALTVIVEEAGGRFTDLKGAAGQPRHDVRARHQRRVASAHPRHPALRKLDDVGVPALGNLRNTRRRRPDVRLQREQTDGGKARCRGAAPAAVETAQPAEPETGSAGSAGTGTPHRRPRMRHRIARPSWWWRSALLPRKPRAQPLDRLLRIQEIAFQEPVRRQRLEKVATLLVPARRSGADPRGTAHRRHQQLRA